MTEQKADFFSIVKKSGMTIIVLVLKKKVNAVLAVTFL